MQQHNIYEGGPNFIHGKNPSDHMFQFSRYEKPTWTRNRINYERTRAIYNEDMQNRIRFVMRKNRKDPYPGTV